MSLGVGEAVLVGAMSALKLGLLVAPLALVLLLWRRLRNLEARLDHLERHQTAEPQR